VNGDRRIDPQEFYVGINDLGVRLTKPETAVLFKALDTSGDGNISFNEFLYSLCGSLNA
jgi:Ca2+-binding EF-hand superfamily protein